MDAHLSTLSSTLDSIQQLHLAEKRNSIAAQRPFTSAILNTYKLDVLDFIRDADSFEANLFWYPPTSGVAAAGPSTSSASSKSSVKTKEAASSLVAPDINVAPRLPEPKAFLPPTPLRKQAKEAEARGLIEFDTRTLLKAAQKLLDNYHNAPRARKHLKTLLRKHTELQRSTAELENTIAQNETLIERIQSQGKELAISRQTAADPKNTDRNADEKELQHLQSTIQREEMEIMAIEQMMEELTEQRLKLSKRPVRKTSNPTTPTAKRAEYSRTPKSSSSSLSSTRTAMTKSSPTKTSKDSRTTPTAAKTPQEASLQYTEAADETIRLRPGDMAEENFADETIRLQPAQSSVVQETEAKEQPLDNTSTIPQSSDELERICENIWAIFGDQLRFSAPADRETGNLFETLDALQKLSTCNASDKGGSAGDISIASSSAATSSTAATSGSSTASGTVLPSISGMPSPTTVTAAHVLITLLNTAAPHTMDVEKVRQDCDKWWNEVGRLAYIAATGKTVEAADVSTNATTGNNTLGTKAVYDLTAKKLVKLRFAGKQRLVSFPANIP